MKQKHSENQPKTSFCKDDHNRIIRVAVLPFGKVEVHMLVGLRQIVDDASDEDECVWVPYGPTVPDAICQSDIEAPYGLVSLRVKNRFCPSFMRARSRGSKRDS